jgi:hypothetical protein
VAFIQAMKIKFSFSEGFVRGAKWLIGLAVLSLLMFRHAGLTQSIPQAGAMPDLTIDAARLAASLDFKSQVFQPGSCALAEEDMCVDSAGKRTLMRFDVAIPNIGTAPFVIGNPTAPANTNYFEYSPCHGHYHFIGFVSYELLDGTRLVKAGRKQAFCLIDFAQYSGYQGTPAPRQFVSCSSNQGISVGWQDVYTKNLECQWLDVTDVPAGDYTLRVTVNAATVADPDIADPRFQESDYDNNTREIAVRIGKKGRR